MENPEGPGFTEPIQVPAVALKPLEPRPQAASASPAAEDLLIPGRSEDPRYPKDFAIGKLGAQKGEGDSYGFARRLLEAVYSRGPGIPDLAHLPSQEIDALRELFSALNPIAVRLASGVSDPGGGYSYLIRFIGNEKSSSGELFLRPDGDSWLVDEIRLDPPVSNIIEDGINRYDPFIYTRFF